MSDLKPIFDNEGNRLYNVRQAAKIIGGICEATLARWAERGVTSFGFKIDVKFEPLIHAPNGYRHEALAHREVRRLVPEEDVLALKDVLQEAGKPKRRSGGLSASELERLEEAAIRIQRRRRSQIVAKHL